MDITADVVETAGDLAKKKDSEPICDWFDARQICELRPQRFIDVPTS